MSAQKLPIKVFFSYSHKDDRYREALEEHLAILKRSGAIESWSDRRIVPGAAWEKQIDQKLEEADVILLLVSNSFMASDYCVEKELARAIARHEAGKARVIPIFVRACDWADAPFAGIQGLPKEARPVSSWENEDLAWLDVAKGLKRALEEIREQTERLVSSHHEKTLREALAEDVQRLDALYQAGDHNLVGLPTGFVDLDRVLGGLRPGEVFTVASRPSMGKTNLALQIASAVAELDLPVLIFSFKQAARDVARRMITATGSANHARLSTGRLDDEDWPRLTFAVSRLADKTVLIDDSPSLGLEELRKKCLRKKAELGAIPLVIIDSVDYITKDDAAERGGMYLKSLARELNAVVLATANISRAVEARPNKRPVLADVHAFPDLVDESDNLAFIYRDSFYNPDSPDAGTAEIIVAKNANGRIASVRLSYLAQQGAFFNYAGALNKPVAD